MPKYHVEMTVQFRIAVHAKDEDSAIEEAFEQVYADPEKYHEQDVKVTAEPSGEDFPEE